jgi:hypothetical protein
MATELYDLTVPAFTRGLTAMAAFLEKGRAWAEEKGLPESTLIEARLYEDMHPLPYQVQRVSDSAKFTVQRLGELEPVPMEDNETSFAQLQDRISRTLALLAAVKPEQINGREGADVVLKTPRGDLPFKGLDYAIGFALPNFYFHVTAAYAILRNQGVPVGKMDFLGAPR